MKLLPVIEPGTLSAATAARTLSRTGAAQAVCIATAQHHAIFEGPPAPTGMSCGE